MNYVQFINQNLPLFILISTWSMVWKGLALWRASQYKQKYWFVAILVLNTIGILEIVYLTWFVKKDRFWERIYHKSNKNKS